MSARAPVHDIFGYLFVGLVWVAFTIESGSLSWVITGGLATSGVAFAISRQWKFALDAGVVVAGIISLLGIMAMFSPVWYKGLL